MVKNDRDKLKTLLEYWVAHNKVHSVEFKKWAEKAGAMGEAEAAANINAPDQIDRATSLFANSLKKLVGEGK